MIAKLTFEFETHPSVAAWFNQKDETEDVPEYVSNHNQQVVDIAEGRAGELLRDAGFINYVMMTHDRDLDFDADSMTLSIFAVFDNEFTFKNVKRVFEGTDIKAEFGGMMTPEEWENKPTLLGA
jgi:hypothetical protein